MSRGAPRRSRVHSRCRARRRHNPLHSIESHSRSTQSEFCVRPHGRFMADADRRLLDGIVTRARAPGACRERRKSLRGVGGVAVLGTRCHRFRTNHSALGARNAHSRPSSLVCCPSSRRSGSPSRRGWPTTARPERAHHRRAGAVARPLSAGRTGACGPRRPSSRAARRWRPPCRGRPPAGPRSRRASARRSDSRSPP